MAKVYYISESQYKHLVEAKKEEKRIFKQICEELENKRKRLTEATQLNEGIIDTIKSYLKKGVLTVTLIASLLSANQVNAQQLQQAGVPKATIEQAIQKTDKGGDEVKSLDNVEKQLVRIMKKNNLQGSLDSYNKLNPQQKNNVLTGIQKQIKNLDDINYVSIGNWEEYKKSGDNLIKFDTQTQQKISVVTVDTVSTVPVTKSFKSNSVKLENPEQLKQELNDLVKGFSKIDSITIEVSSSTLRNRGEAEGMTWKELSQQRGNEVANLLIGQDIDLGGGGVNKIGEISANIITINADGTNGDGTSGPKSPYEVNPEYVKSYQERGIDPSLWQSAAKEDALPELSGYEQYQKVNVKIYGSVVETQTEEVPSFRYVSLQVREMGGKIKVGNKREKSDVSKCSVKVKKIDHVQMKEEIT